MQPHFTRYTVATFALALWWGSLTVVGFGVVPLLFANLDNAQAAGRLAALLFRAQDWLGWFCAAAYGFVVWNKRPETLFWHARTAIFIAAISSAAALLSHALVAPRIMARQDPQLWHSLGSGLYLLQWLCATALLYRHARHCPQRA
jgi:Domain of unknown function (DUF4149)